VARELSISRNTVHHDIHGRASIFNKGERGQKKSPCSFTVYGWQNDEPRVKFCIADQSSKVSRVLGDDHAVLGNAPCEYTVVRLTTSTNIQRMTAS
jgi:hypothetical protein